jgi:hypothetical protein
MSCFVRSTNAKSFGMTLEPMLRLIAGLFVGLNLMQSAATDWCPMMTFLKRLGVKRNAPVLEQSPEGPTVQPMTR